MSEGCIRSSVALLEAIAAALLASPLRAAEPAPPNAASRAELYRAQTVVTGTGEANRLIGFAHAWKTF